jgi:salicylate hydroxylase
VDFSNVSKIPSMGNRFLDWKGKVLLSVSYDDMEKRYGAPYYFLHRADLVKLLAETAQGNPRIRLRLNSRVAAYDFDTPSVSLESGEVIKGDVVVCADGIKSAVRDRINGRPIPPQDTGDVAYRILVPAKLLLDDPEMAHLMRNPWAMHWLGPEGHAVGYPLRGGELYNIIIDVTHSSDLGEPLPDEGQIWKSARSNRELVERFKDWCPEVRKLCAMTGEYLKWKLADFDQLDHWVSSGGSVCLLGDSCHPMMPYMAQGAAQATEDAAALAATLRQHDEVSDALRMYEKVRKPRTTYIARNTRVLQEWLHLYDGSFREERDRMMSRNDEQNPIYWGWSRRKDWLFRYDACDLREGDDIPSLPPMPPDRARVYLDKRNHLRNGADI